MQFSFAPFHCNVFLDKCSHSRLLVISGDQLVGLLLDTQVGGWQIVVHLNDLLLQSVFHAMRDIYLPFVQE